jgi:hypothetical protein
MSNVPADDTKRKIWFSTQKAPFLKSYINGVDAGLLSLFAGGVLWVPFDLLFTLYRTCVVR